MLIFSITFSTQFFCQSSSGNLKYYLEIPNSINIPVVTKNASSVTLTFSNSVLTNLFKGYNITNFELAFPGGKNPILKIVYIIECDPNLIVTINNSYSSYFGRWEEVQPVQLLYIPNDLGGTTGSTTMVQSELTFVNAQQAWDISKGDNVKLGNAESALSTHEDLINKITNLSPLSSSIHGTQVAVLAAGDTDNGAGIASLGFNSKIYTYGNSYSALIPLADRGVRAINMSWGSCSNAPLSSQYGQIIVDQVWNSGVVLVAAAGNGSYSCSSLGATAYHYPAGLNNIFAVTSIGHKYPFINGDNQLLHGNRVDTFQDYDIQLTPGVPFTTTYNDRVDLNAPGYDILVPNNTLDGYLYGPGTSYAAPMVMGAIGLMFGANPCLFPDEVESILKLTAVKNDLLPQNLAYTGLIGAGRLNAFEAVDMSKDMSLPFGTVEVKERIIDRWDFNLRTAPYEIKMSNNLVSNISTVNFTARNNVDILSGDYAPTGSGYVDLKINPNNLICNTPVTFVAARNNNNSTINKGLDVLFPNPNNGNFSINLKVDLKSEINIDIFNVLGKLVFSSKSKNPNFDINLPELSNGIYILKIFNNEVEETFKFVKN